MEECETDDNEINAEQLANVFCEKVLQNLIYIKTYFLLISKETKNRIMNEIKFYYFIFCLFLCLFFKIFYGCFNKFLKWLFIKAEGFNHHYTCYCTNFPE